MWEDRDRVISQDVLFRFTHPCFLTLKTEPINLTVYAYTLNCPDDCSDLTDAQHGLCHQPLELALQKDQVEEIKESMKDSISGRKKLTEEEKRKREFVASWPYPHFFR